MILEFFLAASLITVIDGDTVRQDGERLRIENIDTPETYRPECLAERMLGELATARLEEIVADGVEVQFTGRTGGYGRPLVLLTHEGQDVGEMLVEEGLAVEWTGRQADWCG